MIERTLILLKPDAVQRGLMGKIITRFEDAGLKIIGMKMVQADQAFAERHYTEDIAKRRGKKVRDVLLDYIQEGPIVALAVEGVHAIEIVRKLVGPTMPREAFPGTIRGDYCHHGKEYCDVKNMPVKNLIHASGDKNDAERELPIWFSEKELHPFTSVHDLHILGKKD
ncbi:MAG: nucleoside-diphosphate kinase [Candidatus Diapherotrites archaeon]|nr:nucleoside-diphosphate kinase [Candidatus Diapherotrites archaeon]